MVIPKRKDTKQSKEAVAVDNEEVLIGSHEITGNIFSQDL